MGYRMEFGKNYHPMRYPVGHKSKDPTKIQSL